MGNWNTIILLLAAGQGILLSLALLSPSEKKDKSNPFLGLMLWVLSLEILSAWGMKTGYFNTPNALPYYLLGSYLILPPSVWLFAQLNTNPAFQLQKKHLLLFVPAIIETLVELGLHVYWRYTGVFISMLEFTAWFLLTEIMPIAAMLYVLFFYGQKLVYFSKQLKSADAPLASLRFVKLYSLFGFLALLTLLWIAGVIFDQPIFGILELVLAVFLFTLGYIGYFIPAFFDIPKLLLHKLAEAPSFPNYEDEKELRRLDQVLEQELLYTRPKLTLEELADALKLPPRYLTYLIKTYHNTNFSNFINAYRVQEVIRKINNPAEQHKTLLAFALEAGFGSKSTFNHAFKKHTGQSPSQYLPCTEETGPKT